MGTSYVSNTLSKLSRGRWNPTLSDLAMVEVDESTKQDFTCDGWKKQDSNCRKMGEERAHLEISTGEFQGLGFLSVG